MNISKEQMKPTIVFIGEDNQALESLYRQLQEEVNFTVEDKICGYEEAFEFLRHRQAPILPIVDLSKDQEKAIQVAQEIKLTLPDSHLLMTSARNGSDTILRAMRSGAEDFFPQPFNGSEVIQSLGRVHEKINLQSTKNRKKGHIIPVYSNKGGVGTTTVETNLAVALAAQKRYSVCIVDLALEFGSVTSFLNLDASCTIVDFVKNLDRIDPLFLDGSLIEHASGVRVLAEPFSVEEASRIETSDIEQVLNLLVQSFDFVIVDCPKDFTKPGFVSLDMASLILFVTTADIPSLKGAHKALELFERMNIDENKVRLILNRYLKNKHLSKNSVEQSLRTKVSWTIPDDYATAMACLNQGLSIVEESPKSAAAKSYQTLADEVLDTLSVTTNQKSENNGSKHGGFSGWWPIRKRCDKQVDNHIAF